MSELTGKTIGGSYKDLLQISNNNAGVDGTLRYIEDGEGTTTGLGLSTDSITLSANSITLSTNQLALNGQVNLTGHVIPSTTASYDLGSAEYKIRHLFLSDSSLYIGDAHVVAEGDAVKLPVNSTFGDTKPVKQDVEITTGTGNDVPLSVETLVTEISSVEENTTYILPAGTPGQMKIIVATDSTLGDVLVYPQPLANGNAINFKQVESKGHAVTLTYTSIGWSIVGKTTDDVAKIALI